MAKKSSLLKETMELIEQKRGSFQSKAMDKTNWLPAFR